jgi:hypothetical protein
MGTQFCVTVSEGGGSKMRVWDESVEGGMEGRERRKFAVLFFRGVLRERQGRQIVRGETRDGKWEGETRTTYKLALLPVDGFWTLTCWGV